MKIAVIGTSNSVLKSGYFATYKAIEYPHQVDLFAIGGTIISYAAFALEYYKILENYDVIITEFSTNDAHRYKKDIVSLEYLYQYIYDVFAIISQAGKVHINLLLGHPNVEKENAVFGIYRNLCQKFHVENIEVHELISSLVKKELWLDNDHYYSNVIREIAFVIKERRKKITDNNINLFNTKKQEFLPIRKFFVKTFCNEIETEQKGTSLYTFPTLMIEKDYVVSVEEHNTKYEGFFYQATPFVGNVAMIIDEKIYDCDLFKAATGFFYHYQTKGQKDLWLTKQKVTFCNARIKINNDNVFTGLEYNKQAFGLVGITFSMYDRQREYPSLSLASALDYSREAKDYLKIYSVVKSCEKDLAIINKITDPYFLFVVAECLEEKEYSLQIYERVCCLSKYINPYFVKKYFEKLLSFGRLQELFEKLCCIQKPYSNEVLIILAQYYMAQKQYDEAQAILIERIEKNPFALNALFLLASIFIQKEEYIKAEHFLEKCRKIHKENLIYVDALLFCFIKLGKKSCIQNLLEEIERYVKQCATIQYKTNFSELKNSMALLTKEDSGKFYPFVLFLRKCNFHLI